MAQERREGLSWFVTQLRDWFSRVGVLQLK
jgi:hypothetical protein